MFDWNYVRIVQYRVSIVKTETLHFEDLNPLFRETVGQEENITMMLDLEDNFPSDFPEDIKSQLNSGVQTIGQSIVDTSQFKGNERPRFVFDSELGEGAYGKVWKASDTDIGRSVAIKTYKLTGKKGYRLCSLEVGIAGKIDHPGVPVLYDVECTDGGEYHYIMKYVDGEPLNVIIDGLRSNDDDLHQRFHPDQRVQLITQILRVLSTVHARGIVHRDIKPENILIGSGGEAYLMDWGIAIDTTQVDGKGQFAGSPMYMSPEQSQRLPLDGRSDLYSLGSTLYELLTLDYYGPKFENIDELVDKLSTHWRDKFDFADSNTQQGKSIALPLRKVIMKACHPDPAQRFQSANEFRNGMDDAQAGRFEGCCPITRWMKVTHLYLSLLNRRPKLTFMLTGLVTISLGMSLVLLGSLF
jgi:serine/threonine protein kinase